MMKLPSSQQSTSLRQAGMDPKIDLENYIPAYLTFLANKWSRGASHLYLKRFGVGVEIWRIMVLLAIEGGVTSNRISQVIHMDKASVSRNLKRMRQMDLIKIGHNKGDRRKYYTELTVRGFALHDKILPLALEREQRLLNCLSEDETQTLRSLLRRLHGNLSSLDD